MILNLIMSKNCTKWNGVDTKSNWTKDGSLRYAVRQFTTFRQDTFDGNALSSVCKIFFVDIMCEPFLKKGPRNMLVFK